MAKRGPKGPHKWPDLEQRIIDNELLKGKPGYLNPGELAKVIGCTLHYLYRVRSIVSMKGLMPFAEEASLARTKPEQLGSDSITPDDVTLSKLMKQVENEPVMTQMDRIRVLSRLIKIGSPTIKIQAIKAVEELTRGTEKRVGPPDPLTEDERLSRISRILLAAGKEDTDKAYAAVFNTVPEAGGSDLE